MPQRAWRTGRRRVKQQVANKFIAISHNHNLDKKA